MLLCGNHDYKKETFDLKTGEIRIEDDAWVGARCTVCPGVNIGENSVLSVGSVTSKNLESNGIYQGNLAILKRNPLMPPLSLERFLDSYGYQVIICRKVL
mgnify:CR=1 FL=1